MSFISYVYCPNCGKGISFISTGDCPSLLRWRIELSKDQKRIDKHGCGYCRLNKEQVLYGSS